MCRKRCMDGSRPTPESIRPGGRRAGLGLLAGVLVAVLVGCAQNAHGPDYREVPLAETTFSFAAPDVSFDIFKEYRLVPGDILDVLYHVRQDTMEEDFRMSVDHEVTVRFIDVPELTETQNVRPDGSISLPYLGVIPVSGRTVSEVTDDLKARYSELAKGPFRIAIDHEVAVKFVDLPELNEVQFVRPDGTISLPYLGVVTAAGKSIEELTAELKTAYTRVLKSPELYVLVTEPRSVWTDVRKKLQQPNLHIIVRGYREAIVQFKHDLHTAPRGLSRLVTIRPDGYATFALIGDMFVADKTIPEVDAALDEKYQQILLGLSVDLFLEEHSGSQIYVLGNVKNPGAYRILKPTPVVKALALAGSFLPGSEVDDMIVYRRHENKMVATKIDTAAVLRMEKDAALFYLQPDDILYVPRTALGQTADVMRDIADILFFRGWTIDPLDDFDK